MCCVAPGGKKLRRKASWLEGGYLMWLKCACGQCVVTILVVGSQVSLWSGRGRMYRFLFCVEQQPNSGPGRLIIEVSWSHTIRHARALGLVRRSCQLVAEAAYAAHNKQKRRTSVLSAEFEPAISAMKPLPPGWARKFSLMRTKSYNTRWCRCCGLQTARCIIWITDVTDSVWTDSLFTRYEVLKAVLLLMFHVFWDVQEVLECLVLKMKALRSSLEPLSCNVAPNSVISLWRCQMLMTEHLTNVVRTRTNFWISFYWIKSQGENAAPYFVSLCVATVERNTLVSLWTYCIYQWTRRNVKEDLFLQLSTLFCPIIPSMFGVHIQSYRLCLSESKHKTKKCGYFRGHFQFFFTKLCTLCWTLEKILGQKRDKVTEEWRNLHNEELFDLYCSPNIILVIKSRR